MVIEDYYCILNAKGFKKNGPLIKLLRDLQSAEFANFVQFTFIESVKGPFCNACLHQHRFSLPKVAPEILRRDQSGVVDDVELGELPAG